MTRKHFNWNYTTAHELGRSRQHDDMLEEREFVHQHSSKSNREYKEALRARQRAKMDALGLLPNIYA
jgi:hypothetical protein